jgi:precorrin isomerase
MYVSENGQKRRLVECIFDAAQHQRAVRIGHVEDHDSDGVAAAAAQRAGEQVGAVAQLRGSALDAALGIGNAPGALFRTIETVAEENQEARRRRE